MTCYHPLKAFRTPTGVVFTELAREDILGDIELPCGRCIGCRMRRASDWELRVMHEASLYENNCFVTLTYRPGALPPNASLCHEDWQLFMKRARQHFYPQKLRFYMCGEYGDLQQRPHYHGCLFNAAFTDQVEAGKSKSGMTYYQSAILDKLWGHGIASVQPLVKETASYCARYIMKKALGETARTAYQSIDPETGEIIQRKPEYAAMSNGGGTKGAGGIGAAWYEKYHQDVHRGDYVIADGAKRPPPKYYDKLLKRRASERLEQLQEARSTKARQQTADQTPERLATREAVHLAKVSTLKRTLSK
ncbi:MAG: replication initiator protein [Microvirus sp.]|nr:MAG: replication initiator protein [Microvirus sp.]